MRTICLGFAVISVGLMVQSAGFALAQPMRPPELPTPTNSQPTATEPGFLGMVGDDRQENGRGVRVKDVEPDGPAAKGGLQTDDLITGINGQGVHTDEDVGNILHSMPAGARVTFQVDRQGKPLDVEVTLGHRPPPDQRRFHEFGRLPNSPPAGEADQSPSGSATAGQGAASSGQRNYGQSMPNGALPPQSANSSAPPRPLLGVRTMPVTEQDQVRLVLPSTAGAHVVARTLTSPAERANIPVDAVITALNGQPVQTPNQLSVLLLQAGAGAQIDLTYFYNGKSITTHLTLAAAGGSRDIGRSMAGAPMSGAGGTNGTSGPPSPIFNPPRDLRPHPSDSPPRQNNAATNQADAQRIDALEHRVEELEQKVKQLESQQHGT